MASAGKSLEQLEEEAREWIEAITGQDFMDSGNFVASLGDGVLLCKCVRGGARAREPRFRDSVPPSPLPRRACRAPARGSLPPSPTPPPPPSAPPSPPC